MKRYGHLYEKLLDKELLSAAFDNASRNKHYQRQVRNAKKHKEEMVDAIYDMLLHERYVTSKYTIVYKYEPKLREISVLPFFPDRIIHHAIMLLLEPILVPMYYEHSYSCVKGKGQHKAVEYNRKLAKKYKYCLKCDISKFYPSIRKYILKDLIRTKFKDERFIKLLYEVIDNTPVSMWIHEVRSRYEREKQARQKRALLEEYRPYNGCLYAIESLQIKKEQYNNLIGVPIGNYLSQFLGNWYLTGLDNLVCQRLKPNDPIYWKYFTSKLGYVRYCDDFILYSNSKKELNYALSIIKDYLFTYRKLILSKSRLYPTKLGIDFCGYKVYPNGSIRVRKSTQRRIRRRVKTLLYYKLKNGYVSLNTAMSTLGSYYGWLRYAGNYSLIQKLQLLEYHTTLKNLSKTYPKLSDLKFISVKINTDI